MSQGPLHRGRSVPTARRSSPKEQGIPAAPGCARRLSQRGGPSASLPLRPLCRPGEKKRLRSSPGSLSLPAASGLAPCLPWAQRTLHEIQQDNWRHGQGPPGATLPSFTFFKTVHPVLRSRTCGYSPCPSHLQPPYPASPGHPDSHPPPASSVPYPYCSRPHPSLKQAASLVPYLLFHCHCLLPTCSPPESAEDMCLHWIKPSSSTGLRLKPQLSFLWTQGRM